MSFGPSTGSVDTALPRPTPAPEQADLSASVAARVCALLATLCLGAVLPILMVVANKSAPAIFGAAAVFANAAVLLGGAGPALRRRYGVLLTRPTALTIWLVLALMAASFAWSIDPGLTRRGLVEGLPELAFALGCWAAWPLVARRGDMTWLAIGIIGAAVLIVFEKKTGMPLHALVKARGEAWDLKRSAIPPALLVWPAAAYYVARRGYVLAATLAAAAVVGIVSSHSGSPGFGLIVGAVLFALARLAPRAALGLAGALFLGLVVAGPFTGTLASRFLPTSAQNALREEHASHRILIWKAFEDRAHDRPLLGHGFDTSFKVSTAPRPGGKPPSADNAEMVDNHPHNIVLQFWVELGLAGALAAVLCFGYALRRLSRLPAPAIAPRLGLLFCVLCIGLVGLSAWQPWWIASIAVAMLWFDRIGSEAGA